MTGVPRSTAARAPTNWVMSAELVETTKLYARTVGPIRPEWLERIGAHLLKSTYSEPHWSRKRAAVMARERVTLYGVPLVLFYGVGFILILVGVLDYFFFKIATFNHFLCLKIKLSLPPFYTKLQ